MNSRITILAVLAALTFGSATGATAAEPAGAVTLNIQSQSISRALMALGEQAGLQVIVRGEDIGDHQALTPSIQGAQTVRKALDRLLNNTGLTYEFLDERTVRVLRASQEKTSAVRGREQLLMARAGSPSPVSYETTTTAADSESDSRTRTRPASSGSGSSELVVTGSRLRAVDRTAPIVSIDRETIEKRGFSTAEDIVRSLPQNLSNINAVRSVTQPVGGDQLPVGPAPQGEFLANLRGIGQAATLVLIDGRRTAGSAAFSGEGVNLATIPVAAIERIDVLADSAAAVYGSDAIAGVINIVMRKDYRGSSSSLRFEDGDNGGDKTAFDQIFGFGWGGGNLTATLSVSDTKPVDTFATGYTTNNLSGRGGFDYRSTFFGQPGNILSLGGSLPPDYDGTEAWTPADVSAENFEAAKGDLIRPQQTSDSKDRSIYVRASHGLSDRIEGFASVRYTEQELKSAQQLPIAIGTVSAASPYNPTGQDLLVYYAPFHEYYETGLLPWAYGANDQTGLGVDAGLRIDLPLRDWQADINTMYSFSRQQSGGTTYSSLAPLMATEINPFGNGTAQNIDAIRSLYGPRTSFLTDRKTTLKGLSGLAEGSAFDLPAGNVRTVMGAEYRVESLSYGDVDYLADFNAADRSPSQSVVALFTEASVPLLQGGAQSLAATLQARWERYDVDTTLAVSDGKRFDEVSPRVGLVWSLNPGFALRGSWGQSFKAPSLKLLVQLPRPGTSQSNQYDPIEDEIVPVYFDTIPNPDLLPESGETITLGLDWSPAALPGVDVTLTYNRTDVENQIVGSYSVIDGTTIQDFLARPDLFPGAAVRDPQTNTLLRVQAFAINVAAVEVEAVDFDVQYALDLSAGQFHAGLQGTYTIAHNQQLAPVLEVRGLQGTTGADRFRSVLWLGWTADRWGVDLYGNHTGAYFNTEIFEVANPSFYEFDPAEFKTRVGSRTTWDLSAYHEFGAGWRVSAGARNVFDEGFPIHQGFAGPYDTRRVDLRGRLLHFEVRKDFSF